MAYNYIINGNFTVRDAGEAPSFGSTGGYLANKWWAGPGTGGTVFVTFPSFDPAQTDVPGYPSRYCRMNWTIAPTIGEAQYSPAPGGGHTALHAGNLAPTGFRWTFLEHLIPHAMHLMGQNLNWEFYCRIVSPGAIIRPIIFMSYNAGGSQYGIFDQAEFTPTCSWVKYSGLQTMPPSPLGMTFDGSECLGFGLDFPQQTGCTLDLANFKLWNAAEALPVEIRRYEQEVAMARA